MYAERYGEAALLPGARWRSVRCGSSPRSRWGRATLDRLHDGARRGPHQGKRPVFFERGAGAVEADIYNGDAMAVGASAWSGPAVIDLAITGHRAAAGHQLRAAQAPATSS